MKFIMLRDRVVASTLGHSIRFAKGVPTFVPPEMYTEVIAAGGAPEEEIPEDQMPPKSNEPQAADEREMEMFIAFETIVTQNKREDFTAGGNPRPDAMARELGWTVGAKEIALAYQKFKMKEE